MLTFTPITLEHHALLRKYYAGCDYHLCEYSAGTKLMWSLYLRPSFAEEAAASSSATASTASGSLTTRCPAPTATWMPP